MIIEEKRKIPERAKTIKFFWQGSGNSAEVHQLLGVGMYDKDGVMLSGIGEVEHEADRVEDYTVEWKPSPGYYEKCVIKACENLVLADDLKPSCLTTDRNLTPPEWCPHTRRKEEEENET